MLLDLVKNIFGELYTKARLSLPSQSNVAAECLTSAKKLEAQGDHNKALTSYYEAIKNNINIYEAYRPICQILKILGRTSETIESCKFFIKENPNNITSYGLLTFLLLDNEELQEAMFYANQGLRIAPNSSIFCIGLGLILSELNRNHDAVKVLQGALIKSPGNWSIYFCLGVILLELKCISEAETVLRQSLLLNPNHIETKINLSNILDQRGDLSGAAALLEEAAAIGTNLPSLANNLGTLRVAQGRYTEALSYYEQALILKPDFINAHKNYALALLSVGEFERGWREYDYHFHPTTEKPPRFSQQRWTTQTVSGKTILIYAEQGLGDTLHFVRYIPFVAALGAKIILEVQPPLVRLLNILPNVNTTVSTGQILPEFDYQCPISSLPAIFNTTVDTIPADVPYLPLPNKSLIEIWQERLSAYKGIRVGLVWAGNPNRESDHYRSMSLETFAPLLEIEGISFFSLQKWHRAKEPLSASIKLKDFTDLIGDFVDTAAFIECLDLVISVDTSVAHLAGALGKPVWVLLGFAPCWRYFPRQGNSLWYPTMRLFKQPIHGDWKAVIENVATNLSTIKTLYKEKDINSNIFLPAYIREITNDMKEHIDIYKVPPQKLMGASLYFDKGVTLQEEKSYELAFEHYQMAIQIDVNFHKAYNKLRDVLHSTNRIDQIIREYKTIIEVNPNEAVRHMILVSLLISQNRFEEGLSYSKKAILLLPNSSLAYLNLGTILHELGRNTEGVNILNKALLLNTNDANIYLCLGISLMALKQFDEAEAAFWKAIEVDFNCIDARIYLSSKLQYQGKFLEAEELLKETFSVMPDSSVLWNNWAALLAAQGKYIESLASFEKPLALDSNSASTHKSYGLALLAVGNFQKGWKEFDYRREIPTYKEVFKACLQNQSWQGESLAGKKILLYGEQGIGDTLQFLRYVPLVVNRGAHVTLYIQPALVNLLNNMPNVEIFSAEYLSPENFDYQCSLFSLPQIFDTMRENIPKDVPYLPKPCSQLIKSWKNELGISQALRVGLVWAGNSNQGNDHNRSIPLTMLAPLLSIENVSFFSLQKDEGTVQLSSSSFVLKDLGNSIKDFSDTAAIIETLDLLISVDTSVAHLAGALGKPVWVLLTFTPCWRYLPKEDYCLWYPTMRLFRQSSHGDWPSVIAQVAVHLNSLIKENGFARNMVSKSHPNKENPKMTFKSAGQDKTVDVVSNDLRKYMIKLTNLKSCRHGRMRYIRKDEYIGRSLEFYGEFSEAEITLFGTLIRPGDVVIDAGANIGAHTLFFAKAIGKNGRVIAYEPQNLLHQILSENLRLNKIINVEARLAGLGAAIGVMKVPPLNYDHFHNFGGLSLGGDTGEVVEIQTIDSLNLTSLRLIKIDVEGMELDVLRGATQTILNLRPMLYVENDRPDNSAELISLIQEFGYRLWWHLPPLFNPANFARKRENIFGNIVSANMLCIPEEINSDIHLPEIFNSASKWQGES